MTKQQKYNFRMSPPWKTVRQKVKKRFNGFDWLTKLPLLKTWNCHHLDMRDKNYTCIKDITRFLPLNEDTHKFAHWFYKLWCKDKTILHRLELLMQSMYDHTHDDYSEEDKDGHQVS